MKNNIIGFVTYLLATILFSPSVGVILLAMKENSDRCHYYGGKWNMTDIVLGLVAIIIGVAIRYFFDFKINL
ncbi:hypothetical protein [Bacteroides mediterraneensis]|uniref:hypothetical protein n=1 Tax=Bacteroides mediterraneensis TaxID=1841856 RepID=UPI0011148BCA|nr:hypothetical protein [Bacteroides mediterraneensis]